VHPVNCFGDHLLECSHGPMRICHHDVLVDILYRALSQSHPDVLKEQRASCEDQSRPGGMYHPDFQCGRPAFLIFKFVALPSLLIFLLNLLVLGLLLQLGSWPRT